MGPGERGLDSPLGGVGCRDTLKDPSFPWTHYHPPGGPDNPYSETLKTLSQQDLSRRRGGLVDDGIRRESWNWGPPVFLPTVTGSPGFWTPRRGLVRTSLPGPSVKDSRSETVQSYDTPSVRDPVRSGLRPPRSWDKEGRGVPTVRTGYSLEGPSSLGRILHLKSSWYPSPTTEGILPSVLHYSWGTVLPKFVYGLRVSVPSLRLDTPSVIPITKSSGWGGDFPRWLLCL